MGGGHGEFIKDEDKSWLNDTPYYASGTKLDFKILSEKKVRTYLPFLNESSYYVMSEKEYRKVIFWRSRHKYVILVRAIYTSKGRSGQYDVIRYKNGDICVSFYGMGTTTHIYKSILLLQIDELPKNVYVRYSNTI